MKYITFILVCIILTLAVMIPEDTKVKDEPLQNKPAARIPEGTKVKDEALQKKPAVRIEKKAKEKSSVNKVKKPKEKYPNKLIVGKKVPPWVIKDTEKEYHLDGWPNRLVIISYIDPRFHKRGNKMTDALEDAVRKKQLSLDIYQPIAVINCNTTWHPDKIIHGAAKLRIKKERILKPLLLFDDKGLLDEKWDDTDRNDASCFIVIGKDRTCEAIYRGKMTDEQIKELIDLAIKLHNAPDVKE